MLACCILLQFELTKENITLADAVLLYFCKRMERLYGASTITPNMHLYCHTKRNV